MHVDSDSPLHEPLSKGPRIIFDLTERPGRFAASYVLNVVCWVISSGGVVARIRRLRVSSWSERTAREWPSKLCRFREVSCTVYVVKSCARSDGSKDRKQLVVPEQQETLRVALNTGCKQGVTANSISIHQSRAELSKSPSISGKPAMHYMLVKD